MAFCFNFIIAMYVNMRSFTTLAFLYDWDGPNAFPYDAVSEETGIKQTGFTGLGAYRTNS